MPFLFVVMFLLFLPCAQGRGLGESGDVVVVRLAGEGVEAPRDVAGATAEPEAPVPAAAVIGAAQIECAADALRHCLRYSACLDIDHAADGARAVEQGRGALQDFHALCDERVHRDRVVAAAHGNIQRVDPVLHDAHARAAQTANDRAPRAHAVGTVVDARFVAHGRSDVVQRLAFELVGLQHVGGLRESVARERMRQDDDLLDGRRIFGGGSFFGESGRGQQGRRREQGQ